jgi:CubicO group peptidase (beta-lactamase class C family)
VTHLPGLDAALPPQPDGVPWPTERWSEAPSPVPIADLLDEVMAPGGPTRRTFAALVVHRGQIVGERYAPDIRDLDRLDGLAAVTPSTPLLSWSMAKSVTHALVGMLVGDGAASLDDRLGRWPDDDPRAAITVDQALQMRDGLAFSEVYEGTSDVIDMLFGPGRDDVAGFAAAFPLAHPPGARFSYSSGTSNLVSAYIRDRVHDYPAFLRKRLFEPLGMRTAKATFDAAGTFVGSSYLYASARDFARFGLLYLRDGVWDGRRLLPEGWVDHGRLARSVDPEDGRIYGAHWWVFGDDLGTFNASGYEGQSITICPPLDLIVVRLGTTPDDRAAYLSDWRRRVIARFR